MSQETVTWRDRNRDDDQIRGSLSGVQPESGKPTSPVLAILVADIHLSHNPPIARSCETNWYGVMAGYLWQLKQLAQEHNALVICAGDIFHTWKSPPELINFALEHLPKGMYAIPGQHDLPYHSFTDIKKSAYWTMVEAGVVNHLDPGAEFYNKHKCGIYMRGFPWGFAVKGRIPTIEECFEKKAPRVAVVHAFCWNNESKFPDAPANQNYKEYRKALIGYDVAIFGDNHKPFDVPAKDKTGGLWMFNCGGFMRRRIDEKDHKPRVGLLYKSGKVKTHYLDVSKDRFTEVEDLAKDPNDPEETAAIAEFIKELGIAQDRQLSWQETVMSSLPSVRKGVQEVMSKCLQGDSDD